MIMNYLKHPFHFDGKGRAAATDYNDHVRDMIYQVLFTSPGERVNLPDFGCGLSQLVFMPNSDVMATATQFLIQGALQHWLADVIEVQRLQVNADNEKLVVDIEYVQLDDGQSRQVNFTSPVGGA